MIEPIFKYIFAAVIGAMLLVFFIGLAGQHIGIWGKTEGYRGLYAFNDYLAARGVDLNSESQYEYKVDYTFAGREIFSGSSKIETEHIIFSPERINGKVDLTTRTFEFPYATAYLYYLSKDMKRYVFVYDGATRGFVEDFAGEYGVMPSTYFKVDRASIELFDLGQYEELYEGQDIKYIIIGEEAKEELENKLEGKIWLLVQPEDEDSGTVEFADGKAEYAKQEMLLGAIMSDNAQSYNEKASVLADKAGNLAGLYYEKAGIMQQELPECDYSKIKASLQGLSGLGSIGLSTKERAEKVKYANAELGGECPKIF